MSVLFRQWTTQSLRRSPCGAPVAFCSMKLKESHMTRPWFVVAALAASAALLPFIVGAQAPSDTGPPPYRPSLADLMNTTVQLRHVKLAFAGREKNWVLAAYELKQWSKAFDRLSLQCQQWRQKRTAQPSTPTGT